MNENLKDLFARLAEPFHPQDIEWRAGATNNDKTKALALAYITSRAVMDRLDEVVGPENWRDNYRPGPDGGVICGLSLRLNGEWITKWDGADNTEFEAIKGGLSDAFKRAGYKWGIGRYLYRLESSWVSCEQHGRTLVLKTIPALPDWALPNAWVRETDLIGNPPKQKEDVLHSACETQILGELGFVETPKPSPVPASKESIASKSNGNGAKKAKSWGLPHVQAVIQSGLATAPAEAVRLLNGSDLPVSVSPQDAVTALRSRA